MFGRIALIPRTEGKNERRIDLMITKGLKMIRTIFWRTARIGLALMLLFGFTPAQKSENPVSAEDFYRRGLAKTKSRGCDYAVEDFDKAIELNPRDARFYKERGKCLSKEKALADLNKAIKLEPDFAEAYFERGNVHFQQFFLDNSSPQAKLDFIHFEKQPRQ